MGRRKLKFDVRKNNDRKKKLRKAVSFALAAPDCSVVSIPYRYTLPCKLPSVEKLHERIEQLRALPAGWMSSLISSSLAINKLSFLSDSTVEVVVVTICSDFTWTIQKGQRKIPLCQSALFGSIPSTLQSVSEVTEVLSRVDSSKCCKGNDDAQFLKLAAWRDGKFMDSSGTEMVAYQDKDVVPPTIRHKNCEIIVANGGNDRCTPCAAHRKSLHVLQKRHTSRIIPNSSSHINYKYRSSQELIACLQEMHNKEKAAKLQIIRLREKLAVAIASQGIALDQQTSTDMIAIMRLEDGTVQKTYPDNSFQSIFWRQQKEAAERSPKGMRWHPIMIKWCLYLRHLSSKAYETLRESGCISLPSQRTLRDYSNCIKAKPGFSSEVDRQLLQAANVGSCPDWQKLIILLLDEMYVREGLVYNRHTGDLVGFADLGDVSNHLLAFERAVKGDTQSSPSLAKTMMVFMVRGLFSPLRYPYAQFPCETVTGRLLFHPFWEAVYRLERLTLKVLGVTFDGASVNRRLVRLHSHDDCHKVPNIHASEKRDLYFFSDPPHLLKTIRNCWSSSYRKLWNNGSEIAWKHLEDLYERDMGKGSGLAMVPKLKLEHIKLTSFSKMRVDLAAQVLSQSVGHALYYTGGEEAKETSRFVCLVDNFFDTLNVSDFTTGMKQRKRFKYPFRHGDDWRLDWLQETFIPYFEKWRVSVESRAGFTAADKNRMLLSRETLTGLQMTVKSFVALVKLIFALPEVKDEGLAFLSMHLCQDPLENFFGCQRQRGGTSDNPSVAEFAQNTQALRVVNCLCRGPVRGNCRGDKAQESFDNIACKAIPRK